MPLQSFCVFFNHCYAKCHLNLYRKKTWWCIWKRYLHASPFKHVDMSWDTVSLLYIQIIFQQTFSLLCNNNFKNKNKENPLFESSNTFRESLPIIPPLLPYRLHNRWPTDSPCGVNWSSWWVGAVVPPKNGALLKGGDMGSTYKWPQNTWVFVGVITFITLLTRVITVINVITPIYNW